MNTCSRCGAPSLGLKKNGKPFAQCERCRERWAGRYQPRMPLSERHCVACQGAFSARQPSARYCSDHCRYRSRDTTKGPLCSGGCGRHLTLGASSLPPGQATCRECRNPSGHGASQYRRGCRCDICRAGAVARQATYVEKYREEHGENPATASRRRRGWPDAGKGGKGGNAWIDPRRRYSLYARDNWICGLCGDPVDRAWSRKSPTAASLDHIIPQSLGGGHDNDNLTTAHTYCNAVRQTRDFTEFVIWAALEKTTLRETLTKRVPISA